MSTISVLGLGAMGSSLASTLLAAGHSTTVWNRTSVRARDLATRGATAAASPAEAAAASPLVLVCLLDYTAVREVLAAAAAQLRGRTVVNLTNGTPAEVAAMAAWVRGQGAAYVDGAIMVTPEMIGGPHASILYSGTRDAYTTHAAILGALARGSFLGDDDTHAALHDLALLATMFGMFGGVLHAAALLTSARVPVAGVAPMIVELLHAMVDLVPEVARQIDTGDAPPPTSNNHMMAAGLHNILAGSRDAGVAVDLVAPIAALFDRGVAAGLGARDISALAPLLRVPARSDGV